MIFVWEILHLHPIQFFILNIYFTVNLPVYTDTAELISVVIMVVLFNTKTNVMPETAESVHNIANFIVPMGLLLYWILKVCAISGQMIGLLVKLIWLL